MSVVAFPIEDLLNKNNRIFKYESILLVCLNEFLKQYILCKIFGYEFSNSVRYKYFLKDFEIEYLGNLDDKNFEKLAEAAFYKIKLDFVAEKLKKRFTGLIDIKTKFCSHDSFEKSWFDIHLKFTQAEDFNIDINVLTENVLGEIYNELFIKIWSQVFKIVKKHESDNNKISITSIQSDIYATEGLRLRTQNITKVAGNLDDSVVDLYYILIHLYLENKTSDNFLYVKADEILDCKNYKKNINSKGVRSAYKESQKSKIRKSLAILNEISSLNVLEIDKNCYCISFLHDINSVIEIPRKLIEYNCHSHIWHKRIGDYLYCEKKQKNSDSFKIKINEILKLADDRYKTLKPSQVRDKLEKVLDDLSSDNIIKCWEYDCINEQKCSGHNWFEHYKSLKIYIKI